MAAGRVVEPSCQSSLLQCMQLGARTELECVVQRAEASTHRQQRLAIIPCCPADGAVKVLRNASAQRACRSARESRERQRRGRIAPAQSLLAQWDISNPTPLMISTVHTGTRDSMYWYLTREEAEVPRRLTGRGYRHTGTRYGAVTNRLGSRRDNPRDTHKEHGISWDLSTCPLPQASSIGDVHVL